jgi:hypothetical protein
MGGERPREARQRLTRPDCAAGATAAPLEWPAKRYGHKGDKAMARNAAEHDPAYDGAFVVRGWRGIAWSVAGQIGCTCDGRRED